MRGRLILATVALSVASLFDQQPFQSGIELVHVPVVVTGKGGAQVRGLKAQDFEVLEDGRPQHVSFFSEGAIGAAVPLHLGIMLDTSESMEQDLEAAGNAAVRFVDAMDEAVDVTLVDFDTQVRLGRFQPSMYPRLFERIRQRKSSGATALYDALGLYLARAAEEGGQHVLLLYTDGGDTTSSLNYGQLQKRLRAGNVLAYVIGYLENTSLGDRMPQQLRLNEIAKDTGGMAFYPTSAAEVEEIYTRILGELISRYTLGYVSTNTAHDGAWRKLEVHVARPDLKAVKLRARPGYFGPS